MKRRTVLLPLALIAMVVASSCGSSSSSSLASDVIAKLRECNLISDEGDFDATLDGLADSDYDVCYNRCLLSQEGCDAVITEFCSEGNTQNETCLAECDDTNDDLTNIFVCDNDQEVSATQRCDNLDNDPDTEGFQNACSDDSDDEGCDYFDCVDESATISLHAVCNGRTECEDASDEPARCATVNLGLCV